MSREQTLRRKAAELQKNRCYYCEFPVWELVLERLLLMVTLGITKSQAAQLRCTAEHLLPKSSGGLTNRANIVAACRYCNKRRVGIWLALPPRIFADHVRGRIV